MQSSSGSLKIDAKDLEQYEKPAQSLLESASVETEKRTKARGYGGGGATRRQTEEASVLAQAKAVTGDDAIVLHTMINHCLHVVMRGIRIASHVSELYTKASGLDSLTQSQQHSGFTDKERVEFNEKQATRAHIFRFVAAHYIVWELSAYEVELVSSAKVSFDELEGIDYTVRTNSANSMMFQYAEALDPDVVTSPEAFVRMTIEFFRAVSDDVVSRFETGTIAYSGPFTDKQYQLEGSEFSINGFAVEARELQVGAEFNRLEFSEIVGNMEAKHAGRRSAFRLLCYDFETEKNPFQQLVGTTQRIRLGYGVPGTGKSMLIAGMATLLQDLCDMVGVPFLFHPLPDGVISSFQGTSAVNMEQYMKIFLDPTKIVYGAIDDAENLFEDRSRRGVSEGVKSVIGVFLRYTEGAYAIDRGNSLIDFMTNLADIFDPAVLSRIQSRFPINGARRVVDFEDQDHLWYPRFSELDEGFVDMDHSDGYEFLAEQKELSNIGEVLADVKEPSNARMKDIFEGVLKQHDPTTHTFFATLYKEVQQVFDGFSSRDVRNIQTAISGRIVDFDPDPQWMEDPELFFRKDYETKLGLLRELMKANMGNLEFADIRLQEVCRYLDTYAEIADTARERRISERVSELSEEMEARERAKVA